MFKLCFRWWTLPHAFFLKTRPVCFFRGYHHLFSVLTSPHNVHLMWYKWGILLQMMELLLSEMEGLPLH